MTYDQKIDSFQKRKVTADTAQIFLAYMAFVGDQEKTASALDLDPEFVEWLANEEEWVSKVRRLSVMSKGGKPGDHERAVNRALNYIQAHQLRATLSGVITFLSEKKPEELVGENLIKVNGLHATISTRVFSDLASALEKVHALSYAALGDSLGERAERHAQDGSELSADALHAAVILALNSAADHRNITPAAIVEAAQAALVSPLQTGV